MKPDNLVYLQAFLKERSGFVLSAEKVYLLESRLAPVMRSRGLASLDDLVVTMQGARDEKLFRDVTEAMTINETFFFRDMRPFDTLRDFVLPRLLERQCERRSLRIWSAACSSGQEPFSLAILLKEVAEKLAGWRIEIVAIDISSEMLSKGRSGIYSQFEIQRGMPIQFLVKYFQKKGDLWQIDSALRAMVQFREFNLLGNLRSLGSFDVVFCRNVLIYFDNDTKGRILQGIHQGLAKDGALFLGAAETVLGVSDLFKPIEGLRGVYEPVSS